MFGQSQGPKVLEGERIRKYNEFGYLKGGKEKVTMDKIQLDCCPFCGSWKASIDSLKGTGKTLFRGYCKVCSSASSWQKTERDAAAAWNMRAEKRRRETRFKPWQRFIYL
jgi:hypothetical protein